MKIEVNNLYGIKNKIKLEFENSAVLFAPNGTGKTSLTKGFKIAETKKFGHDMEGNEISPSSLKINGKEIDKIENIKVFTSEDLEEILTNPLGIINGFLEYQGENKKIISQSEAVVSKYNSLYQEVLDELKTLGVELEDNTTSLEGLNLINEVNSVLNKTDLLNTNKKDDLIKEYNKFKEYYEILDKSTISNFQEANKKLERIHKNTFDENLPKDFEILEFIEKKDRQEVFAYKVDNDFIPVNEAID